MRKQVFSFALDPREVERIDIIAEGRGFNRSDAVRQAIGLWLAIELWLAFQAAADESLADEASPQHTEEA